MHVIHVHAVQVLSSLLSVKPSRCHCAHMEWSHDISKFTFQPVTVAKRRRAWQMALYNWCSPHGALPCHLAETYRINRGNLNGFKEDNQKTCYKCELSFITRVCWFNQRPVVMFKSSARWWNVCDGGVRSVKAQITAHPNPSNPQLCIT